MHNDKVLQVGFLGAGGQALELRGYCSASVRFCAVEREFLVSAAVNERVIDIKSPGDELVSVPVVAAVGAPGGKRRLLRMWPGDQFGTIVAEDVTIAEDAVIGQGSIISPGSRIMAGANLGDHVLVNTNAVVSHETRIGDFSTISPGVSIGGRCTLGEGVFIGIGATVSDSVRIGAGAVVGAGSVVIEDVQTNEVVVGVPARHLRFEADWLGTI